MGRPVVEIRDLRKSFNGTDALNGVDLDIERGEIFGLLGPNGAGKTTAIQILLGLARPTSGHVSVMGLDPNEDARRIRAHSGYVMQDSVLDIYLTGLENLQMHAELYDVPVYEREARVAEVLTWANLEHAVNRLVQNYSGGMKRRLDLASNLLHRPDLFILDEPTTGLDIQTRRHLWELIQGMKAWGTTVILTTHYLEEANQLCDRVGILMEGQLVALGTPKQLRRELVGDLHHLSVVFRDTPNLEMLDLPLTPDVNGSEAIFRGHPTDLWETLRRLQQHQADSVYEVQFTQPTLDDVFIRMTET